MTGTGKLGEKEFFDLYSKLVVEIPTNHPIIRNDKEDRVYAKSDEKNKAILEKVKEIHATKQPVLLITRTAEAGEYFSTQLFKDNIPNNLLIAQNVAKEAQMIAEAGQLGLQFQLVWSVVVQTLSLALESMSSEDLQS